MRNLLGLFGRVLVLCLISQQGALANCLGTRHLYAAPHHTLLVDKKSNLWTWGGVNLEAHNTKASKKMTQVKTVTSGGNTVFVIRKNHSLWGWGKSDAGQLGFKSQELITKPVHILSDVRGIASGRGTVFAVKTDGSLWSWGDERMLGDGSRKDRLFPKMIMHNVHLISASSTHVLALKKDGSLMAWGNNPCGGIGDGTTDARTKPVNVDISAFRGRRITQIATRAGESFVVTADGKLWSWGSNFEKNCPLSSGYAKLKPTRWENMGNVKNVAAGRRYILILKKDGTLHGNNALITQVEKYSAAFAPCLSNVTDIASGDTHALILKKDGTLWGWGSNIYGELGYIGRKKASNRPKNLAYPISEISYSKNEEKVPVATVEQMRALFFASGQFFPLAKQH